MNLSIILIALGLSMDSFSISITSGLVDTPTNLEALKISLFFGSFQAVMPIIGWFAGENLVDYISSFDHWIAFGLLVLIGSKMIKESKNTKSNGLTPLSSISILLMMSVATSIDALTVGMSLSFLNTAISIPAFLIGVVTFSLCFLGVHIGKRFETLLDKKIMVIGGIILIFIGVNILVDHLTGILIID